MKRSKPFIEDFERESFKEQIFLIEQREKEEQEYYQWLKTQPAIIIAEDKDGVPIIPCIERETLPF